MIAQVGACIIYAAVHYGIPPPILASVVSVEGGASGVVRHNANGTQDLGWAQINTVWLPRLRRYGIHRDDLLYSPCTNIGIAGWVLRGDYLRCGSNWTRALSAYNTGQCHSARGRGYAARVLGRMHSVKTRWARR